MLFKGWLKFYQSGFTKMSISLLFIVLQIVKSECDYLDVKHIVDVITQSQQDISTFTRPENAYEFRPINQSFADHGEFDYIVVGAGSAGAVLATRLSENEDVSVLLLEAGGEENTFSDIPAMMFYLHDTKFNWNYKSVPQKTSCLGMVEQRCPHPRGKGLGGTSIINAAMYVRGNRHDYDSWARDGNDGWSYDEVLPYFIKSENSQIRGDIGYHGKGGLLNVEYITPRSPVAKAFIQANQELGRKVIDYNGKEQLGVSYTQFSTKHGQRQSTGKAFLATAKRRKNLTILTGSYARQVLFENGTDAYGVLFDHDGRTSTASANKEIILSAGAIGSPHILLLSGIGPAEQLKSHGIPVVNDLPVGENYRDHPTIFALHFTTNYSEPIKNLQEYAQDYLNGIGALTVAANAQALAFIRTNSSTTPPSVPNIEVILIPQNSSNEITQQAGAYTNETYNTFWPKLNPTTTFSIYLMLLHPVSTGTITLASSDPYVYPNIDTNFLSEDEDIETMYEGIMLLQEMMDTQAFRKLDAKLFYAALPACSDYAYLSKEQWYCQIRHLTAHIFHPVGTCKMGLHPERGGVVDNTLKVHGINKLRVADTSIIPDSTSGHPNAPAIMVAEKLSSILQNS